MIPEQTPSLERKPMIPESKLKQMREACNLPMAVELLDEIDRLNAALKASQDELERERLRLAACGVVALANTPESAAKARQIPDVYGSGPLIDVRCAVDREMKYRTALNDILDPLAAIKRDLPEGYDMNPQAVIAAMKDSEHYRQIARAALRSDEPKDLAPNRVLPPVRSVEFLTKPTTDERISNLEKDMQEIKQRVDDMSFQVHHH